MIHSIHGFVTSLRIAQTCLCQLGGNRASVLSVFESIAFGTLRNRRGVWGGC